MMKYIFYIVSILTFLSERIYTQADICGSVAYEVNMLENELYKRSILQSEEQYAAAIKFQHSSRFSTDYIIPVVFHIIHNNGPEKVSPDRIYDILDQLNAAFKNKGTYFQENGVNTHIQFCLAQRDESNHGFSGILYHESMHTDLSHPGGHSFLTDVALSPQSYMNIFIVSDACLGDNYTILNCVEMV